MAIALQADLLAGRTRILGPDHLDTLGTQRVLDLCVSRFELVARSLGHDTVSFLTRYGPIRGVVCHI